MTDGRKTKKVIAQIYNDGRSKLIHGASADFAHDWTQVRVSAEVIGRWLLISSCDWLSENSGVDDLNRLRSEEHTSELQSLMRISYAVFCLKNKQVSTY